VMESFNEIISTYIQSSIHDYMKANIGRIDDIGPIDHKEGIHRIHDI
jgi:hypothetical protein